MRLWYPSKEKIFFSRQKLQGIEIVLAFAGEIQFKTVSAFDLSAMIAVFDQHFEYRVSSICRKGD